MLNLGKETKTVAKKKTSFKFTGYVLKHEGVLYVTTTANSLHALYVIRNKVRIERGIFGILREYFRYCTLQYQLCLINFLVWPFLPTHCRFRELFSHMITLGDTHTHIHTHTQSAYLPRPGDRPVAKAST